MDTKRIEWIDISKGLGIILVIMGHTIALKYSRSIYAFHMPLFFLISGLVFNIDKYSSSKSLMKAKAKGLLKPYIIMALFSFFVCLFIPEWREKLNIRDIVYDFYTSNTNTIQNSSIWYLPCLYFTFMFTFLFRKIRSLQNNITVIAIFCVVAFALTYEQSFFKLINRVFHFEDFRLPFKIDTALVASVFLGIGCFGKQQITSYINKEKKLIYILLVCLLAAILSYANGWANLNSLDFGRFHILYYPIALIAIYAVMLVSKYIERYGETVCGGARFKQILLFYGKHSLVIFGFQSLWIRLYLLFFNKYQGLNMELYADNPIYHQIISFVVVTFVLSPMTVAFFEYLKAKGIKLF